MAHVQPDRNPVDFLAAPEIWQRLIERLGIDSAPPAEDAFFDPAWEQVLRHFAVDCRVLSYDQFFNPPNSVLKPGAKVDWWGALSRSTPNRMWRQETADGTSYDLWGHVIRISKTPPAPLRGIRRLAAGRGNLSRGT